MRQLDTDMWFEADICNTVLFSDLYSLHLADLMPYHRLTLGVKCFYEVMPPTAAEVEAQSKAANEAATNLASHHSEEGGASSQTGTDSVNLLVWLKGRGLDKFEPSLRAMGMESVKDLDLVTDADLMREAGMDHASVKILRGIQQAPAAKQLFSCTYEAFKDVQSYLQETHAGLRTLCRGFDQDNNAGGGAAGPEPLFKRVFRAVDTDGSGTIDPKELKRAFEALDVPATEKEVDRAFLLFDTDNNGTIDLDEFRDLLRWRVHETVHNCFMALSVDDRFIFAKPTSFKTPEAAAPKRKKKARDRDQQSEIFGYYSKPVTNKDARNVIVLKHTTSFDI